LGGFQPDQVIQSILKVAVRPSKEDWYLGP